MNPKGVIAMSEQDKPTSTEPVETATTPSEPKPKIVSSSSGIGPSTAKPLPTPTPQESIFSRPAEFIDDSPSEEKELVLNLDGDQPADPEMKKDEDVDILDGLEISAATVDEGEAAELLDVYDIDANDPSLTEAVEDDLADMEIIPTIPLSGPRKVANVINTEAAELGNEGVRREISDSRTRIGTLNDTLSWFTRQQALMLDSLRKIRDGETAEGFQQRFASKTPGIPDGIPRSFKKRVDTLEVSGADAELMFTADLQGYRIVPLLNSGFFLTIRPLRIPEIVSFFNTAHTAAYEYGREMGGWFFVFADLKIKELIMRHLLPQVLINSNYKHFRDINKLLQNISLQDYDKILWAMATLMYPSGIQVKYVCAEENCRHVDEVLLDLASLKMDDLLLVNEAIRKFMNLEIIRDDKDLAKYRTEILPFKEEFRFDMKNAATGTKTSWQIDLKCPSIHEYLLRGAEFNADILSVIDGDAPTAMREQIAQQIVYNYYKMLVPWIGAIYRLDDDGQVKWVCHNTEKVNIKAFKSLLDVQQMEDTKLGEVVKNYIQKTKLTHIAYRYAACPVCGKVPDTSVDGFIPYDVQSTFFIMCLARLRTAYREQRH